MAELPVVLIQKWLEAKAAFAAAQETERGLRVELAEVLFPSPVKGTQRHPLKNGHNIKLVYGYAYKLGNKDAVSDGRKVPIVEQVNELVEQIEAFGNEGPILADRLIKWTPELVVPEYEKLNPNYNVDKQVKDAIDALLTITPLSPQLSLEEPKKK